MSFTWILCRRVYFILIKGYIYRKKLSILLLTSLIEHHKNDLAASLEATIVDILMDKLRKAAKNLKINEVAVAGGVSANNGLRNSFREHAGKYGWNIYIPKFSFTTDNAAMIAITGYYKYLDNDFCTIDKPAYSRVTI